MVHKMSENSQKKSSLNDLDKNVTKSARSKKADGLTRTKSTKPKRVVVNESADDITVDEALKLSQDAKQDETSALIDKILKEDSDRKEAPEFTEIKRDAASAADMRKKVDELIAEDSLEPKPLPKASYDPTSDAKLQTQTPSKSYEDVTAKVLAKKALQEEEKASQATEASDTSKAQPTPNNTNAASAPKSNFKLPFLSFFKKTENQTALDERDGITGDLLAKEVALNEVYMTKSERNIRLRRILTVIVCVIAAVCLIFFAVGAMVFSSKGVTISVMGGAKSLLTISENDRVEGGTTQLVTDQVPNGLDITFGNFGTTLASFAAIDKNGGNKNTVEYFAYTFFVKNVSSDTVYYRLAVNMTSATRGIEKAVRVVLIRDSTYYQSANNTRIWRIAALPKLSNDGSWETNLRGEYIMDELYDKNGDRYAADFQDNPQAFYSDSRAFYLGGNRDLSLSPSARHKYTIIIYLEGGDPDCNNDLIGGQARFSAELDVFNG